MWIATKIAAFFFFRITYTSDVILVVLEKIYLNTSKVYSIQHYVIKFVSDSIQHYVIKFVSDSIQHYVIKFVSDVRHVGGFLHQ